MAADPVAHPKTATLAKGTIPLSERPTLAREWRTFLVQVVPEGAPVVQQVEMRRAWYAGAAACFALAYGGLDADSEPTDLDVAYIETIVQELEQFSRDIAEGRA